ncbi:MAG: hypothetical protein JWM80_6698 [Cyanobacteria bacterium RYN_339]|nr:hypothetical protein [Cyanobacteria bacterium RYN_339]
MRRGWYGCWLALGAVVVMQAGVSAQGVSAPTPTPSRPGMIVPIQGGNPNGVDAVSASAAPSASPAGGGGGGTPNDPQSPGAGPVQGEETSPVGRRPASPTPRPSPS